MEARVSLAPSLVFTAPCKFLIPYIDGTWSYPRPSLYSTCAYGNINLLKLHCALKQIRSETTRTQWRWIGGGRALTRRGSTGKELTVDAGPIKYRIVERATQCGKPLLVDSQGYSYGVHRRYDYAMVWWCITRRSPPVNCHVMVRQEGNTFTPGAYENTFQFIQCLVFVGNVNVTYATRTCIVK